MQIPQPPQPTPFRLLAIDPGTHRTGIAVSDELGLLAHPREALRGNAMDLIARVIELVNADSIDEVIVGLPVTMAGGDSSQTRDVRAFVVALRGALPIPVSEWDERLSSVEAAGRGLKSRDRASGRQDSAAAAIILQAVLDSRRSR
ncbi:MAG: Holliday junction resolvase RuvX [Dehalococcoidia bacterium]